MTAAETRVVEAVNAANSTAADAIAHAINVGFGPLWAGVITLIVAVVIGVVARSAWVTLRTSVLIVVPWALADVIKIIVQRPRLDGMHLPNPSGVDPATFSYPSGHVAFAAALGATAVVLSAGWMRTMMVLCAVGLVALTAWSRLYLGAHYPSDVVASAILVPTCVWVVYRICQQILRLTPPASAHERMA